MAMMQSNSDSVASSRVWNVSLWLCELGRVMLGTSLGGDRVADNPREVDIEHTVFSYTLAALACKLMRVDDGEIHPRERAVFLALFARNEGEASRLRALMLAAAKDAAPMQQYARQLLTFCAGSPQRKQDVLVRLVRVAMADGSVNAKEFEFLCDLSSLLIVSDDEMARLIDDAEGDVHGKPWELLKIKRDATQDEVQKAYRERMRACHPDRWKATGKQALMHDLATRRSVAVNAAYAVMMKQWS
jgi:DnaJ like chaperone protein